MRTELYNRLMNTVNSAIGEKEQDGGKGILNTDIIAATAGLLCSCARVCNLTGKEVLVAISSTWNNLDDYYVGQGRESLGKVFVGSTQEETPREEEIAE